MRFPLRSTVFGSDRHRPKVTAHNWVPWQRFWRFFCWRFNRWRKFWCDSKEFGNTIYLFSFCKNIILRWHGSFPKTCSQLPTNSRLGKLLLRLYSFLCLVRVPDHPPFCHWSAALRQLSLWLAIQQVRLWYASGLLKVPSLGWKCLELKILVLLVPRLLLSDFEKRGWKSGSFWQTTGIVFSFPVKEAFSKWHSFSSLYFWGCSC